MNEMLRKRMSATQQASEQQTGDKAYEQIFQMPVPQTETQFRDVPICKLHPFYTADIGFHPYPRAKLEAFAEELKENGLYERILVRPIAGTDEFEILAGHNRTAAAELAGWTDIPATVMAANDQRAISIAIATNLLRRQDLTIIERGKAYKALLDARNRHGFRTDLTSGESRQKYSARGIVAEFFGVTEYEIRKAVKLAQLILPLAEIVENEPKKLNLACADLIADYDGAAQTAFIEMCQIEGYALNKQTMTFIIFFKKCKLQLPCRLASCNQAVQVHIRIFNRFDMIQVVHLINKIGKSFFIQRFQHGTCCCIFMLGIAF